MTALGWAAVLLSLIREEAIDLLGAFSFNLALPAFGTATLARRRRDWAESTRMLRRQTNIGGLSESVPLAKALSWNRTNQRTAWLMTAAGNRWP
jgi:hypothetical protein